MEKTAAPAVVPKFMAFLKIWTCIISVFVWACVGLLMDVIIKQERERKVDIDIDIGHYTAIAIDTTTCVAR